MVFVLVMALGVALAGAAVYLAQQKIGQFQAERDYLAAAQATMPQLADVVVLRHPLKYGERFTAADLGVVKMQADRLPEGVFHIVETPMGAPEEQSAVAVFANGETRPRAALRSYEQYEAILAPKVTPPGVDAGIMATLAPNMRAFTIDVDQTTAVSGFLRPGDQVDVYWSGNVNDQPVTKLIDSNLKVIAINQSADADRTEETQLARTVTAEVTPEQVAALTLAQSTGKLTLSLVGMQNTSEVGPIEVDLTKIGIQPAAAAQAAPERVCTIKTRKGTDVIETPVPCKN